MTNLQFQLQHYLGELWRRRWSILLVAWAVGLLGAFIAATRPDIYTSRATVFVDTRSLMRVVLQDNFAIQDPREQIENVRRMMYARPNLEEVIRRTDLDLELRDQRDWESMVSGLEEKMILTRQGMDFYQMEYEHKEPEKARAVVQTLLDLFLEEGLVRGSGVNNRETEATRRYLEDQRDELEARVAQIESDLADFERDNRDELAGAPAVASEKRGLENQLAQLESDRLLYEQELSALRARLASTQRQVIVRYKPAAPRARTPEPPPARQKVPIPSDGPTPQEQRFQSLQSQFGQLEGQLRTLLDRLTPQHPDVQAAQRRVDAARANLESSRAEAERARAALAQRIQEARAYNAQVDREYEEWRYRNSLPVEQPEPEPIYGPNPEFAQIQSDIDQRRSRLTVTESKIDSVREAIAGLQGTLSRQPEILQNYNKLRNDRQKYAAELERVVEKVEELKIASDPNRLNFVEFRVIEPPRAPVTPTGPNRLLLFAAAAILALGAGVGLAFLRIQLADNMPTTTHLKQAFDLPILGGVSMIERGGASARSAAGNLAFAACVAAFFTLFAFVTYRYHFELWRPNVAGFAENLKTQTTSLF